MNRFRYSLIAALGALAVGGLTTPTVAVAEDEQPLIELLTSDAPKADKAITCKKLAIWGSEKSVPALAALLPDPELASWARIALEVIPGPAADKALRVAMTELDGRQQIGVVNSLGVRQDAKAVGGLTELLQGDDADLAGAAAAALGRIGNKPAIAALQAALDTAPEAARSDVAEACILAAEQLRAADKMEEAAKLYDAVLEADVPQQRVVEATRGAILARGADGVPMLLEQLNSDDRVFVRIGVATARELTGSGVSQKLVSALPDFAPELQAQLILALADRGDAETMPAMLDAAQEGPLTVRVAAIEVLGSLGDATCVPVLLKLATADDGQIAEAAKATLGVLPGDEVDADLTERLSDAQGAPRLALIEVAGKRRLDAVPALLEAVDDPDAEVRAAALTALGQVARLDDVSVLISRVVKPSHAEDAPAALKALQAACVRMPQREECAEKLSAALDQAPVEAKVAILKTLKEMGGETALETLGRMAKSDDARMQDAATQILGEWMTVDAGDVLLELANDPGSRYQIRALRGYIRLPRQFGLQMADEQRVAMCRKAWDAAERNAEYELILDVIQRYPSKAMQQLALEIAEGDVFAAEAKAAAEAIGQQLPKK